MSVGGGAAVLVGGGTVVSAGWCTAVPGSTAAFAGGGTAIFTATLLSAGIAVLATDGAAMLGGGTDVSAGRATATVVDGRAIVDAAMADDVTGAPVTADTAAAAPIRQSADEVDTVGTAGPESDGGGTSYFFLAAYCAYWCLK